MGLESAPQRAIDPGLLSPSSLVRPAEPVVTPSAVSALTDAFRQGFVTADDVISRIGPLAKAKEKAQLTSLEEFTSPEAAEARRVTQEAGATQAQEFTSPQAKQAREAEILSNIYRAQAAPGNYDAKLAALTSAGVAIPVDLSQGLTPQVKAQIDEEFNDLATYKANQVQALNWVKDSKETQLTHADQSVETVFTNQAGQIVPGKRIQEATQYAATPYKLWKAQGKRQFNELFGTTPGGMTTAPQTQPQPQQLQQATPQVQPQQQAPQAAPPPVVIQIGTGGGSGMDFSRLPVGVPPTPAPENPEVSRARARLSQSGRYTNEQINAMTPSDVMTAVSTAPATPEVTPLTAPAVTPEVTPRQVGTIGPSGGLITKEAPVKPPKEIKPIPSEGIQKIDLSIRAAKIASQLQDAYQKLIESEPGLVGFIDGRVASWTKSKQWNEKVAAFETKATEILAPVAKGTFNETGVLSDKDVERYKGIIPDIRDNPKVGAQKAANLFDTTGEALIQTIDTWGKAGYDNSGFLKTAEEQAGRLKKNPGVVSSQATPAAGGDFVEVPGVGKVRRVQ